MEVMSSFCLVDEVFSGGTTIGVPNSWERDSDTYRTEQEARAVDFFWVRLFNALTMADKCRPYAMVLLGRLETIIAAFDTSVWFN